MRTFIFFSSIIALLLGHALQANAQNFYEVMLAAQAGDANAMYKVARMFKSEGDTAESRIWMIKAANNGSVDAQVVMGYVEQYNGNHKQAFYWMSKAAEKGDAEAEYELGSMYMEGLGVKADTLKGILLWTRAAEKDYGEALVDLAYYYETKDPKQARRLAERALSHAKLSQAQEFNAKVLLLKLND